MKNVIQHNNFIGYFGNSTNDLYDSQTKNYTDNQFVALQNQLKAIMPKLNQLVFLKQTHSNTVIQYDKPKNRQPLVIFQEEGDAIITQQNNIAIGVATADCVPLILHDKEKHAIGIIHAGWRGLSKHIITKTIAKMHSIYKSKPEDIQAYVGPAAKVCCYEVQPDFIQQFKTHRQPEPFITQSNDKYYFNAKLAVLYELLENKILQNHIDFKHHDCTICCDTYCSFRRQKQQAGRQPTIAILESF